MKGGWSASYPSHFTPGTQWIGGWVGPRTGLYMVTKRKNPISATAASGTPDVQSIA